jgi:putative flippase GtrA
MHIKGQFFRYVIVGLASNASLYAVYLLMTWSGLGPKTAMSLLYCIGVLQTFVFNKSWSFRYGGEAGPALLRYVFVYALGYIINITVLMLMVDWGGMPHQWVMAGLVIFMALFFFTAQKFWVFQQASNPAPRG